MVMSGIHHCDVTHSDAVLTSYVTMMSDFVQGYHKKGNFSQGIYSQPMSYCVTIFILLQDRVSPL